MSNHISALSFKHSQVLYDNVKPNESVLWTGLSQKVCSPRAIIAQLGFAIVWLSIIFYNFFASPAAEDMSLKEQLFSLPFIAAGLFIVFRALKPKNKIRPTLYALTNKHAYMIYPHRDHRNETFPIHKMTRLSLRTNTDDTQSIVFDIKEAVQTKAYAATGGRNARKQFHKRVQANKAIGFLHIHQAEEVLEQLKRLNAAIVVEED